MASRKRPRPGDGVPDPVKVEEGRALHSLWKIRKKRTQAVFADSLGYSSGYFPQFFSGMRPLTTELAVAFAAELEVDVVDFSPRLAKELDKALEASEWPFKSFTRTQYLSLTHGQRIAVEGLVVGFLTDSGVLSARRLRRVV